ncbi:3'-5' exonuclease [Kitasatospora cystarginea]|uniref:DNA 3'-5' helicase n=1 Tax=Kitasatospora cystarginea TaxID=58350 RepID=A0ABP5RTB2_9ACTN
MTARLSLYPKAEQELYKLDRSVKATFYDFSDRFRQNPRHVSLKLRPLKGNPKIHSAWLDDSYRVLLTRTGTEPNGDESWLVIAVRHRRAVYEQLSVAVNRVTGEIEFVDLSTVGESALRRAGINLTPAEPEDVSAGTTQATQPQQPAATEALLAGYTAEQLSELGVAEPLIALALAVTTSEELDQLVKNAPLLSQDVLYGLAAQMPIEDVRAEITARVAIEEPVDTDDFTTALARTAVTSVDEHVAAAIEQGDFRAWKYFLHPTQARLVNRDYSGEARVSGGPGTGKTIVALHRVHHLAKQLPPGQNKPILLTTFTKNLTTDLRNRLASLLEAQPELMDRVDIVHIDQLASRVLGENAQPGRTRNRIDDKVALAELRTMLFELDERAWEPEFLMEEWEQVILGQSIPTRSAYFQARRAGRGRPLTRPERNAVWKLIEQFTTRLDKAGMETWGQASERAARYEIERAARITARQSYKDELGAQDLRHRDDGSGMRYLNHRYRHIVIDEAQDLRPAHWKMLRAMVASGPNDMFITGDTHQRIYDNQVALSALGIKIRGRSSRLTLSYRTTKEILAEALKVVDNQNFDDLDDGTDTLNGYRSVLHGPAPQFVHYDTWQDELEGLATTMRAWHEELATDPTGAPRDPRGLVAIAVAERDKVNEVMYYLTTKAHITCAELTKDGPRGDGMVHVGTMHRFKGLEYQKLAIVAASDGILPRTAAVEAYRTQDPARYERELRKARALLFVATTRARDALTISWHGKPSPFLPS